MLHCTTASFRIKTVPVQQQSNNSDCGVFYIAFAVELMHGACPSNVAFEVNSMREHLLASLQVEEFAVFPKTEKRIIRNRATYKDYPVNCVCRQVFFDNDPDEDKGKFMASCKRCCEWFHK